MKILFWTFGAIIIYTWIGYFLLLSLLKVFFRRRIFLKKTCDPSVTVLLTVHNEESIIASRLRNILDSDYPKDMIEVLVASDGSTDGTEEIVKSFTKKHKNVTFFKADRGGKSATQNKAISLARGEVVVLTDARTVFTRKTIDRLVSAFGNDDIGCASGRLLLVGKDGTLFEEQSMYWRFEMLLRKLESHLGLLHTASGSVMAIKKEIFKPFEPRYGEDCVVPLDLLISGYRIVHIDDAQAYDSFPATVTSELKSRIRMTLRNFNGTLSRYALLNPFIHPCLSFAIISHKVLRWLTPFFMLTVFFTNLFLVNDSLFFISAIFVQCLFYALALIGFLGEYFNVRVSIAFQIFSFVLANVGFFLGVLQALSGKRITSYET